MPPLTPLKPATTHRTALLLVDIQAGLTPSAYFGHTRSTPNLETNLTALLSRTRTYNTTQPSSTSQVLIIHVNHNSTNPLSPLYPGKETNLPMSCATPAGDEVLLYKSIHSAFGSPQLQSTLLAQGIKQLFICGISTAHCVSTTVRQASDLNVVGEGGVLALIEDASAAFSTEGWDAETVHKVNVASLEGEFAWVARTKDVLESVLC
jgi:nicotinamidase-related amidase